MFFLCSVFAIVGLFIVLSCRDFPTREVITIGDGEDTTTVGDVLDDNIVAMPPTSTDDDTAAGPAVEPIAGITVTMNGPPSGRFLNPKNMLELSQTNL